MASAHTVADLIAILNTLPPDKLIKTLDAWLGEGEGIEVAERERDVLIWNGAS